MYRSLRSFVLMTFVGTALAWTGANRTVADTIIGNWESGTRDGWVDWNSGAPTTAVEAPTYAFNSIGATQGTGAIQYNSPGGYTQWMAIKLQLDVNDPLSNGIADYRPDFVANTKLAFDLTIVDSEQTAGNDFANLGVFVNSNGAFDSGTNGEWGFTRIGDPDNSNAPESVTPFDGFNNINGWNPSLVVGTQTSTWTYDIGFFHDGDTANGEIVATNYIELIFEEYSNNSTVIHIDNVRFITPQVITANFDGNTVVDGGDLSIWKNNFGATGQTSNANGDANGNGTVDGGDFLLWQQQFGATVGAAAAVTSAPEPAAALLATIALGAASLGRRRPGDGR